MRSVQERVAEGDLLRQGATGAEWISVKELWDGTETPLTVAGQPTSMGRLLLGPTQAVTAEQTAVMFKNETDGQVREAQVAYRLEGAPLDVLIPDATAGVLVRDADGNERVLSAEEARGAVKPGEDFAAKPQQIVAGGVFMMNVKDLSA